MGKMRKLRITIETDRLLVIHKRNIARAWCESCGDHTDFATLADVCALTRYDADLIHQQISTERLHSVRTPDGQLLICLRSALTLNSNPV